MVPCVCTYLVRCCGRTPDKIFAELPIDWLLIVWCRETIVFDHAMIEMSRVLGCPGSIWVAEVHVVQSKPDSVALAPLKGIHERRGYVSFHIYTIKIICCN